MGWWEDIKDKAEETWDNVQREWGEAVDRGKDDKKKPPQTTSPTTPSGPTVPPSGSGSPVPTGSGYQGPNVAPVNQQLVDIDNLQDMKKGMSGVNTSNMSLEDILKMIKIGREETTPLVGMTGEEAGQRRRFVSDELSNIYQEGSAGYAALKQDANQRMRSLKAQQMQSGGGQMDIGQQQALARQKELDAASFMSGERMNILAAIDRDSRGKAADIMKGGTSYASLAAASRPPHLIQESDGGLLSEIFGLA